MALHLFMAFNYLVIFFIGKWRKSMLPLPISLPSNIDPEFLILVLNNVFLRRAWLLLILLRSGFIALTGLSYYDYFSL